MNKDRIKDEMKYKQLNFPADKCMSGKDQD